MAVITIITSRKSLSNNLLIFSKTLYVFLKIKLHFSIWRRVEKNWVNSEMVNLSKTATKFSVSYIKKDKLIFRHKNHQQHTAHEHVHALMTHSSSEIAFPQLHGEIQEKSFIGFSRKESLCYCLQLCSETKKEQWIIFTMSYTNNWVQSNNNITNYYIQHTILSTVLLNRTEFMTLCIIYFQKVKANVQKSNGLSSVSETNNWAQNYNNITDYSIQLTAWPHA